MGDEIMFVTREQYTEMLIDESFRDASEMESGFIVWVQRHAPAWRKLGNSEEWIRQRIESAQITRDVHRKLKEQRLTMIEMRGELRKSYTDYPQLYDLAREAHPDSLRYRGDAWDLRQRYTLRIMVYDTDKQAHAQFCRWSHLPMPTPEAAFVEQPDDVRVIRDLSTVENLELALAMCQYMLQTFTGEERFTSDQLANRMEAYGAQLRMAFILQHGYEPEHATTPYIPVTIDGPQDHDSYFAKEFR